MAGAVPHPFAHGVASGDPAPHGVVLWTRLTPRSQQAVPVRWRVATTPDLGEAVATGEAEATPERDFTVQVDVQGLEPATTYHYGFESGGVASPVGRTRTAPSGRTERLRLGVVSCAAWSQGFFNAYAHLAERDVDAVVHLGDYIYEDSRSWEEVGRSHQPPARLRTLDDYRTRHAQYRTDPDLQRLHQRHPVVAVWDDHDLAGNAWRDGAADHDPDTDGAWPARRTAAVRAYLEWLPVRRPEASGSADVERIYRTLHFGDLAQLTMLDTRLAGRDRPAKAGERPVATVEDRDRSLLGAHQRGWLFDQLHSCPSRWRLIGNQVMMAPLRVLDLPRPLRWLVPGLVAGGAGVNAGQWDGYPEERKALFELLAGEHRDGRRVDNVVVLTGDLHSSWAGELTLDPGGAGRAVGVELVTPSVTARSFADELAPPLPGGRAALRRLVGRQNPHFPFFDLEGHGYLVVDITPERMVAEWWHVDTVARPVHGEHLAARWSVNAGEPRLVPAPPAEL